MTDRIVVGVDGSHDGDRALAWAVGEARRRGSAVVEAVHVWSPASAAMLDDPLGPAPAAESASARSLLDAVVDRVDRAGVVRRHLRCGPVGPVLVDAARSAALLVVGRGDHGRLHEPVPGLGDPVRDHARVVPGGGASEREPLSRGPQ